MSYLVWMRVDVDGDLWRRAAFDTFDAAAAAWLAGVQAGQAMQITEVVPVGFRDLRHEPASPPPAPVPITAGAPEGRIWRTTPEQRVEMRRRLLAGEAPMAIATDLEIMPKSVYQMQARMRQAGELPPSLGGRGPKK